ncbi:MAG TPA: YbdK family carboxylate-amine ligase, partial [Ktedonobacteraceae bacterium]|nr:YbdK family carboxylate-amine ligase [Ktedonobacteraceae bacterium]
MSREVEAFTIGVEEEFQIVDPLTYALSADVERILPRAHEVLGDAIQYELILSQVELVTPVCHTLQDVKAALTRLRRTLVDAAAQEGKCVAAAGTHPFSPWYDQIITPKGRYRKLASEYQRLIKEQVIFGCHVHVGISNREIALEVMNRARIWLPLLLVLSASSPFWDGMDTKYASFRTGLWWSSPL